MFPSLHLFRIWPFIKNRNALLLFSASSATLNKVFDLMPPLLVGWVIDTLQGQAPLWIIRLSGTHDPLNLATLLSVLAVLIFALESFFQWAYQFGFMNLAQLIQHELRNHTYAHLQTQDIGFFEDRRTGDTLTILNDDVNQLERFFNSGISEMIHLITLGIVACAILFSISWQLSLVAIFPIPIILVSVVIFRRKMSPIYQSLRDCVGKIAARIENNLSGMLVIQSFSAENFEAKRVDEASTAYLNVNKRAIAVTTAYIPLVRMIIVLGFAGVLWIGSYWVLSGANIITAGELVLFAMMTERLLWPITRMGPTIDNFERANASAKRLFEVLDTPSLIQDPKTPIVFDRAAGGLSFQDVSFQYQNQVPILKNITFHIAPGEIVGIAGPTGSGKSTIIKLAMRFYDPNQGHISIDGHHLKTLTKLQIRKNIALVSQDTYLFHGSIFQNIAYGLIHTEKEKVFEAAEQAELHQFIMSLPDTYDTIVGERGIKLSGGQRQRLSIARAILKNAPIMIFDEATSAVDTETERAIQKNLEKLTAGKTALIIAHRLSTIRNAHRILVVDQGRLVEEGAHQELVAGKKIYADLWATQIGQAV